MTLPITPEPNFKDIITQSITDLEVCIVNMLNTRGSISNFMPLFDINFLKADTTIDINKIDFTYLTKMGKQLIDDNQSLANDAVKLNDAYGHRIALLKQLLSQTNVSEEQLLDAHTELFTMTENVMRWLEKYSNIIINGIAGDLTQHYHNAKFQTTEGV